MSIQGIAPNVLYRIGLYLGPRDLISASQVCRVFRTVFDQEKLWEYAVLQKFSSLRPKEITFIDFPSALTKVFYKSLLLPSILESDYLFRDIFSKLSAPQVQKKLQFLYAMRNEQCDALEEGDRRLQEEKIELLKMEEEFQVFFNLTDLDEELCETEFILFLLKEKLNENYSSEEWGREYSAFLSETSLEEIEGIEAVADRFNFQYSNKNSYIVLIYYNRLFPLARNALHSIHADAPQLLDFIYKIGLKRGAIEESEFLQKKLTAQIKNILDRIEILESGNGCELLREKIENLKENIQSLSQCKRARPNVLRILQFIYDNETNLSAHDIEDEINTLPQQIRMQVWNHICHQICREHRLPIIAKNLIWAKAHAHESIGSLINCIWSEAHFLKQLEASLLSKLKSFSIYDSFTSDIIPTPDYIEN